MPMINRSVGSVAGDSRCRRCGATVPSAANYCLECGLGQASMLLDPLGVNEPSFPSVPNRTPDRRGLVAVLALVVGMVVVLSFLARDVDPADRVPLSSDTPEETTIADDPAASKRAMDTTTDVATTTSTTTPTTTTEQLYVNASPGPVLGDDVGGVLVEISSKTMRRIDLSTGAIERIDLEHSVRWEGPESGIAVGGKHVAAGWYSDAFAEMIITDLTDGTQDVLSDIAEGGGHIAGRASADSVWLVADPWGEASAVIEVDVTGEVSRRVEIPQGFWVRSADGDDLLLEAIDGSFRYDAVTETAVRLPGTIIAHEGSAIMASCDESLHCDVLIDRGSGPEVVDSLDASTGWDGSIQLSPDLTGALVVRYGWGVDFEFFYVDLRTGTTRELGDPTIDAWAGVVWIEDSPWIIGRNEASSTLVAIDTETAEHIELNLDRRIYTSSFLAFVPSD